MGTEEERKCINLKLFKPHKLIIVSLYSNVDFYTASLWPQTGIYMPVYFLYLKMSAQAIFVLRK